MGTERRKQRKKSLASRVGPTPKVKQLQLTMIGPLFLLEWVSTAGSMKCRLVPKAFRPDRGT